MVRLLYVPLFLDLLEKMVLLQIENIIIVNRELELGSKAYYVKQREKEKRKLKQTTTTNGNANFAGKIYIHF